MAEVAVPEGAAASCGRLSDDQWGDIWRRSLAAFAEEAGGSPGAEGPSSQLDAWELRLLVRCVSDLLPSSCGSTVGGKVPAGSSTAVFKRLALPKRGGQRGMTLQGWEQQFQRSAAKALALEAADEAILSAERLEREADLPGARAALLRALDLGPSSPLDVHLRLAQLLRVLDQSTLAAEGGPVAACEGQLRLALGPAIVLPDKPLSAKRREVIARLALLLCQEGRRQEAVPLLETGRWSFCLSDWVLHYPLPSETDAAENGTLQTREEVYPSPLRVFDDALPQAMTNILKRLLAPRSIFWQEHGYNEVRGSGENGYFSYLHEFHRNRAPATAIDALIHHIHGLVRVQFPELDEATSAEWWAHCRPHPCGHQLHFDSDDEGKGGARHPICSCVFFVEAPPGVGGPTIVTDQKLGVGGLAQRGWLVYPRPGRLAAYDGAVLHGVVPGRGDPPPEAGPGSRRVTWMVAFWRKVTLRPFGADGLAGSNRPFPDPSAPLTAGPRTYTWQQQLAADLPSSQTTEDSNGLQKITAVPMHSGVWVRTSVAEPEPATGSTDLPILPTYAECFQW
mmetsp:Transcript_74486/g.147516  ORF Transcript_74486/g.147516 Transcript_74486/m.147516 type:complete len:566 (+) Transcript_74486:94-1791(+)